MKERAQFDEVIHSPVRLRICGLLRGVSELEFSVIRDTLELSNPTLSKNLKILADAGYLSMTKESSLRRTDSRRLTWVSLTTSGQAALAGHLAALTRIAEGLPPE